MLASNISPDRCIVYTSTPCWYFASAAAATTALASVSVAINPTTHFVFICVPPFSLFLSNNEDLGRLFCHATWCRCPLQPTDGLSLFYDNFGLSTGVRN